MSTVRAPSVPDSIRAHGLQARGDVTHTLVPIEIAGGGAAFLPQGFNPTPCIRPRSAIPCASFAFVGPARVRSGRRRGG